MPQLTIQQAFDLATQHHRAGRLQEAEGIYRQILTQQPEHPDALHHLGLMAQQVGRIDSAVDLIRRAIARKPDYPEAHFNLGNALRDRGQIDQAIDAYRRAITLQAGYAQAFNNLGGALRRIGQLDQAIDAFQKAVTLRPDYAEAHINLGIALHDMRRADEAIAAFREAISVHPSCPEAHYNLGNALQGQVRLDEAAAAYRQAIALRSDDPEAHSNLGTALQAHGQLDEAVASFRRAIAIKPDSPLARYNLSLALLLQGDFRQGWEEYEWRWKSKNFPSARWNLPQPQWNGSDLANRTIFIHDEQGLGDTIQFIRYVPLVAERGGRVIFGSSPHFQRLLRDMSGVETWLTPGEALPSFDVYCPLLSLPRAFKTTLESIPGTIPYLFADPKLRESWRIRLAAHPHSLNVALVWAGSSTHKNDRKRSIKLAELAPLLRIPGARFFSLQKGDAAAQITTLPKELELIDWTGELTDFADTAALIDSLDLVISVDTAVAHLAGAMGKPVWLMLPFVPDWRWLLDRSDSPWYPTMRLFRQPAAGDWGSVVTEIANVLSQWTKH